MAEPPEMAASKVTAPERDVLLATKLHVPGPQQGFVPRPRLAERLDEGLSRGLVLACAPAGYGKTVLLADWAQRGPRLVAWLSLDSGDNDPARFWRHAVAALDRVCPGIGGRVGPLLGPPAPSSFEPLVTTLINELTARPSAGAGDVLLVLDDYHLIDSQPVHASLKFLLEHRPPGLQVALSSRADPPLALARLRARGQLAELRAAELRFTADEAAALLQQVAAGPGVALPDADVAALAARTEGWAAGLQLAALSLRGQEDMAGFVAAFTGSHRYVLDYLAEEVLERQGEEVRAFLLETSVLERLSGELCDAVTGHPGSQALLEQVERAGLFLVPLDEVRVWWRYHHLFADLLRARLREEQPGRVGQMHRNAAAWCEEHELADDAIHHAVAAGEMTWAARLIEQHFNEVFFLCGEAATIHRWLSALPDELVRSRPWLLLALAWIRQATGDPARALAAISEAEQASPGPAGLLNPVPAQRARLLLAQGDLAGAARWVKDRGLRADDDPDYPHEPGHLVLARVLLAQDRPGQALALLDRLHTAAVTHDRVGSIIETSTLRALALAVSGEETAAVSALAGALTLACPEGYVRVFADDGPPMPALLSRLIAAQRTGHAAARVPLGCLARLQRAFDSGHAAPDPGRGNTAMPGLVEPLTSRELEVLGMLAAGRSNQAIAGQLVVTLDTVKKHVSHLLGKLGAANRTEAVSRARELGLIP